MPELGPMKCRLCEEVLIPSLTTVGVKANSYSDCFYGCANCRVAYSNRQDEAGRTLIYDTWERNIPVEVHAGMLNCLQRSLNQQSRPTKLKRLSFQTSEDAVSWTVFRYLQDRHLIDPIFGISKPRVLFWGAEYPVHPVGQVVPVAETLRGLLLSLGEHPDRLSEPDLMLVSENDLIFVEVKYRSLNSRQREYKNFGRYLKKAPGIFRSPIQVSQAGFYELTRNVVIASALAKALRIPNWKVINLASTRCQKSAVEFQKLLKTPKHFEFWSWKQLLDKTQKSRVAWFQTYLQHKGLE